MAKGKRYGNLNDLIGDNERARMYFMSLPDYVQGMIQQRSSNIHTERDLDKYAENLLAGDK